MFAMPPGGFARAGRADLAISVVFEMRRKQRAGNQTENRIITGKTCARRDEMCDLEGA